jgi:hypothetical protein
LRTFTTEERRARLLVRHHVAPEARKEDVVDVARDMVGLHSSDAASVYLAAWARIRDFEAKALEKALYEDRSLLRILGMRRTMFVVPTDLAPVLHAAASLPLAARERRRLIQQIEVAGITDRGEEWINEVERQTLEALAERGEATGSELSRAVPGLRTQMLFGQGTKWEAMVSVTTRLLFTLAGEGRIVRGRPRGSWVSTQYRWALMESWVPGGLPELPLPAARTELIGRWLKTFGPGTRDDVRWWTGWTAAEVDSALAALEAVQVGIDGTTGYVLPDDLEPVSAPAPSVAFLPALDPTVMGWTARGWYLGEHASRLFDRAGNAGPTVWWDGRIIGGWAQRKDGTVTYRLLEDVGAEAATAADQEASRLQSWLGAVHFIPRFRTPLEVELSR